MRTFQVACVMVTKSENTKLPPLVGDARQSWSTQHISHITNWVETFKWHHSCIVGGGFWGRSWDGLKLGGELTVNLLLVDWLLSEVVVPVPTSTASEPPRI